MSEPVQKGDIDLSSLNQALGDSEGASDLPSDTLKEQSSTLAQPAKEGREANSPATLSPSSPRSLSPRPNVTNTGIQSGAEELKAMFPELDSETVSAVLSSRGGDQESAVNALLQMSDPDFKPAKHETQADADAMLAQSLAMDEQKKHMEQLTKQQQRTSGGRGGGGAASFFDGILGSSKANASSTASPNYDPNVLTYQPRVKKPMPAPGSRFYVAQPQPPAKLPGPSYEESLLPGLPGPKDARQWQDEINKMAETGIARAASTFSSLKQRANAAFNAPPSGNTEGSTNDKSPAFQGFQQASSSYATESKAPAAPRGLRSPRSPNASEYDRDPSPVSDNELAKIISGGGGPARGSSGTSRSNDVGQGSGNKAKAFADRYGLGIKKTGASPSAKFSSSAANTGAEQVYHGWEEAGRTPASTKSSTDVPSATANRDSIALMDGAQGRGVSSPRKDRSPVKENVSQSGLFATGTPRHGKDPNDDNDSDDLEYVSNPFEDED